MVMSPSASSSRKPSAEMPVAQRAWGWGGGEEGGSSRELKGGHTCRAWCPCVCGGTVGQHVWPACVAHTYGIHDVAACAAYLVSTPDLCVAGTDGRWHACGSSAGHTPPAPPVASAQKAQSSGTPAAMYILTASTPVFPPKISSRSAPEESARRAGCKHSRGCYSGGVEHRSWRGAGRA